jgi:hypothetical protein
MIKAGETPVGHGHAEMSGALGNIELPRKGRSEGPIV